MRKTSQSGTGAMLLEATNISASYGHVRALKPTSLMIEASDFVTVLGPNGAGKTTLMRAITKLIRAEGQTRFKGEDISALPTHALANRGIVMVQEGRGLFGSMSVRENLMLGAFTLKGSKDQAEQRLESVFELFPRLKERYHQVSSVLSGGEQQMLAIGRALMAGPKLLMLDEPSLGLAPRVAAEILETLRELNSRGMGILLVEQKAPLALKLARRVYILSLGRIVAELQPHEIESHHDLARYYFQ
jgi:branched-chain amino acid transport system ATP-binding protein